MSDSWWFGISLGPGCLNTRDGWFCPCGTVTASAVQRICLCFVVLRGSWPSTVGDGAELRRNWRWSLGADGQDLNYCLAEDDGTAPSEASCFSIFKKMKNENCCWLGLIVPANQSARRPTQLLSPGTNHVLAPTGQWRSTPSVLLYIVVSGCTLLLFCDDTFLIPAYGQADIKLVTTCGGC